MTATLERQTDGRQEGYAFHLFACLVLLAAGAVAHLLYLTNNCPLDLAGDEALYWQYTNHLALSYYCKGPMIAYIIGAGRWLLADWSQRLVGSEMLAVRVPAIVLSVLTGIGIYVLASSTLRRPRLALAAIALTFTMPVLAVGAVLMTIDTPWVFAWTWALVFFHRAIRNDSNPAWVAGGVFIAIGILSKYTMLLIYPVVGLLLLMDPAARRFLRRCGPYVAMLIGFAGLIPILIWNAQHDWVGFRHVAGQAGVSETAKSVNPFAGLMIYLGGQAGVIGPLWFVGMIWAAIDVWRRPCDESVEPHDATSARLLVLATLVPFAAFLPFSLTAKIEPNWPVVAVIGGTILLALWLPRRLRLPTAAGRAGAKAFVAVGVILGLSAVFIMHRTEVLMPLFVKLARNAKPWEVAPVSKYDPASRLRGWAQLGREVGEVLAAQRAAGRDPFIVTDNYMTASEIAFYCPGQPPVYNIQSALGSRMSEYDIWENPIRDAAKFIRRPCIYVGALKPALTGESGEPAVMPGLRLVRTVEHKLRGVTERIWPVYVCDSYAGFAAPPALGRKY